MYDQTSDPWGLRQQTDQLDERGLNLEDLLWLLKRAQQSLFQGVDLGTKSFESSRANILPREAAALASRDDYMGIGHMSDLGNPSNLLSGLASGIKSLLPAAMGSMVGWTGIQPDVKGEQLTGDPYSGGLLDLTADPAMLAMGMPTGGGRALAQVAESAPSLRSLAGSPFAQAIPEEATNIMARLQGLGSGAAEKAGQMVGGLSDAASGVAGKIGNAFGRDMSMIPSDLVNGATASAPRNFGQAVSQTVKPALEDVLRLLTEEGVPAVKGAVQEAPGMFQWAMQGLESGLNRVLQKPYELMNDVVFLGKTPWQLMTEGQQAAMRSEWNPLAKRMFQENFIPSQANKAEMTDRVLSSPRIQELWTAVEDNPQLWRQYNRTGSPHSPQASEAMQQAFYDLVDKVTKNRLWNDFSANSGDKIEKLAESLGRQSYAANEVNPFFSQAAETGAGLVDRLEGFLPSIQPRDPLKMATPKGMRTKLEKRVQKEWRNEPPSWRGSATADDAEFNLNQEVNRRLRELQAERAGPEPVLELLGPPEKNWYGKASMDTKARYDPSKGMGEGGLGEYNPLERAIVRNWLKNFYGQAEPGTKQSLDRLKFVWDQAIPYMNPTRSIIPGMATVGGAINYLPKPFTGQTATEAVPEMLDYWLKKLPEIAGSDFGTWDFLTNPNRLEDRARRLNTGP